MGIADIPIPQQKTYWASVLEGYNKEEDRKLQRKESDRKDRESDRKDRESDRKDKLVEIEEVKSGNANKIAEQTLEQTKRTNFMNDLKLLPPDVGAVFARNFLAGDNEGVIDANFVDQYAEVGNTFTDFKTNLNSYFTGDDTYKIDNYNKLSSLAIESGQQHMIPYIKSSYDSSFDKQSRKNTMDLAVSLLPSEIGNKISGFIGGNITDQSLEYMDTIIKSHYKNSPEKQKESWAKLLEGYKKAEADYDDMTPEKVRANTARAIAELEKKVGLFTEVEDPAPQFTLTPESIGESIGTEAWSALSDDKQTQAFTSSLKKHTKGRDFANLSPEDQKNVFQSTIKDLQGQYIDAEKNKFGDVAIDWGTTEIEKDKFGSLKKEFELGGHKTTSWKGGFTDWGTGKEYFDKDKDMIYRINSVTGKKLYYNSKLDKWIEEDKVNQVPDKKETKRKPSTKSRQKPTGSFLMDLLTR